MMVMADLDQPGVRRWLGAPLRSFLFDLRGQLPLLVVYDHPLDFPEAFIARLHTVRPARATDMALKASSLETLRDFLAELGMVCLDRDPDDDQTIVETWL